MNLSFDEVSEFVADTLGMGIKENKDATNILYTKAKGNMFFTKQLLEDLFQKNCFTIAVILSSGNGISKDLMKRKKMDLQTMLLM